jgi:hypothetical protein
MTENTLGTITKRGRRRNVHRSGEARHVRPIHRSTTEGWLQRLGGRLVAALIGLILVPASIVLQYWNEGRAVDAIRALKRGAAAIVEVDATRVYPLGNGKLVRVSGMMQLTTAARDHVFGVTGDGLLRLSRSVEMYQWKEETSSQSQQSVGESKTTQTTYTYQHAWSDQPIASGQFKLRDGHQNPPMQVGAIGNVQSLRGQARRLSG